MLVPTAPSREVGDGTNGHKREIGVNEQKVHADVALTSAIAGDVDGFIDKVSKPRDEK